MKRAFLLIAALALLVALGFAQTPAASINTDQTTIKGCLGGSDGNYTVVEDNTGHIYKITTSSVDLKALLSHAVILIGQTTIGHKASGTSSAPSDDTLAVTELKMISDHCAPAPAASTAPVPAPSETAGTPPANATPPDAPVTAPAETASTPAAAATALVATIPVPAEAASAPAAPTSPPVATASTPAGTATTPAAPVATIPVPAETASAPAAASAPSAETTQTPAAPDTAPVATIATPAETAPAPAARHRRHSETAAAAAPAVTAGTPAATGVTPIATDSSTPEPVSTPAAVATPPPAAASNGRSLWLLIGIGVLVVAIGTLFPFFNRWRKRRSLEGTAAPNLSFNREASSDQTKSGQIKSDSGKSDQQGPRKAA